VLGKTKARTALEEMGAKGDFKRVESGYREWVSETHAVYKPEIGRYHLYISKACPWADRCNTVRHLKGLTDIVSLSVVHPTWKKSRPDDAEDSHHGWAFASESDPDVVPPSGTGAIPCTGCIPDPHYNAKFVRDLYDMVDDKIGKYTVPILFDTKTKTIVNNESSEIMRMFNGVFAELAGTADSTPDLYPVALREAIDAVNEWVYPGINNGVYRCGFAKTQEAYDEAIETLYSALDRAEEILSTSRYMVSNTVMTEADFRLFMTLVRFDEVYVVYFKCNKRLISSYPNIHNFCREMYQLPCVQAAHDMDHIKRHYFTSHAHLNAFSVIPAGPDAAKAFMEPHDRDRFNTK